MKHKTLFFSISMLLLVFTAIYIYIVSNPRQFPRGLVLSAQRLSAEPEKYIAVTDPDPYLLEALSYAGTEPHSGRLVCVGNWENTNIDDLVWAQGTHNLEYNGAYYTVEIGSAEPPWPELIWVLLFSWIALGVGFIISQVMARLS